MKLRLSSQVVRMSAVLLLSFVGSESAFANQSQNSRALIAQGDPFKEQPHPNPVTRLDKVLEVMWLRHGFIISTVRSVVHSQVFSRSDTNRYLEELAEDRNDFIMFQNWLRDYLKKNPNDPNAQTSPNRERIARYKDLDIKAYIEERYKIEWAKWPSFKRKRK